MRLDQFTLKAQEALTAAQTRAEKNDHPEVTTEHRSPPVELLARDGVHRLRLAAVVLAADDRVADDAIGLASEFAEIVPT